ncbi:hypothetical protein ACM66B_001419 [Microbotryomycetes sp. NB124-2]
MFSKRGQDDSTHHDSSTSSSNTLQVSNSRVTLSVTAAPPLGSFAVGSTIRPRVHVHATDKGDKSPYSAQSLRFVGTAKSTIMGKDRWQAAQVVNAAGGGPAMPVTSQERVTFIDLEVPLVSPAQVKSPSDSKKSSDKEHSGECGGTYELLVPSAPDGQLLPTYRPAKFTNDLAMVGVKYELEFVGKRPGLLKLDDKLSVEIPICVALPQVPASDMPIEEWPSTQASRALKFKGPEAASLGLDAILSCKPLSGTGEPIKFQLVLQPSHPSALALIQSADQNPLPKVLVVLNRRLTTSPIDNPGRGKTDFRWASICIQKPTKLATKEQTDGSWKWQASIAVPPEERTVLSKGLSIEYTLACQISSPALENSSFAVSLPVFLPSAPAEVSLAMSSTNGAERVAGGVDDHLPAYSV